MDNEQSSQMSPEARKAEELERQAHRARVIADLDRRKEEAKKRILAERAANAASLEKTTASDDERQAPVPKAGGYGSLLHTPSESGTSYQLNVIELNHLRVRVSMVVCRRKDSEGRSRSELFILNQLPRTTSWISVHNESARRQLANTSLLPRSTKRL